MERVADTCSPEEPFVSIIYDQEIDALVTCTYSKDTVNRTGQIRILNKLTLNTIFTVDLGSAAFHLDFSSQSSLYMTGLSDGRIAFFNAQTRELKIETPQPAVSKMVTDAKLSPDAQLVGFTSEGGGIKVCDRESLKVVFSESRAHILGNQAVDAWSCEFLSQEVFATGGDDNVLRLWDLRTRQGPMQVCKPHLGGVVRISKFGDYVCTGSYDKLLRFFDQRLITFSVNSIKTSGGVWDFKFEELGGKILIANMYGGVTIVDSNALEVIQNYPFPDELIYGISTIPEQPYFYCCSFTSGSAWRVKPL